jgi:hypothetical protein
MELHVFCMQEIDCSGGYMVLLVGANGPSLQSRQNEDVGRLILAVSRSSHFRPHEQERQEGRSDHSVSGQVANSSR